MPSSPSHRHETATRGQTARVPEPVFLFDRRSVQGVDRAAIEEYGIPGIVLMENAARGLAHHAMAMLARTSETPSALIICGGGNNGGDGYALARHLHNAGVEVVLAALQDPLPTSDAGVNHAVCSHMKLPILALDTLGALEPWRDADLVVDAIFGTGLDRDVAGLPADVIGWINDSERPVLAVDVPSGLDCNTGRPLGAAVRATRTVTFVGLKPGLLELQAQPFVGEAHVAGIGAPRELLERFGRRMPPAPPDRGHEA